MPTGASAGTIWRPGRIPDADALEAKFGLFVGSYLLSIIIYFLLKTPAACDRRPPYIRPTFVADNSKVDLHCEDV